MQGWLRKFKEFSVTRSTWRTCPERPLQGYSRIVPLHLEIKYDPYIGQSKAVNPRSQGVLSYARDCQNRKNRLPQATKAGTASEQKPRCSPKAGRRAITEENEECRHQFLPSQSGRTMTYTKDAAIAGCQQREKERRLRLPLQHSST